MSPIKAPILAACFAAALASAAYALPSAPPGDGPQQTKPRAVPIPAAKARKVARPSAPTPVAQAPVRAVTEFPSVVTVGSDHVIRRWSDSGKQLTSVDTGPDGAENVRLLAISPAVIVAAVDADGGLRIWNLTSGQPLADAPNAAALCLTVSPDGALLATGGSDSHIRLWSRQGLRPLADVRAHSGDVRALQFSWDGMFLVSGGADRMVRTWRVQRVGDRVAGIDFQLNIAAHDGAVNALAISPDDTAIASVAADGFLKLWRSDSGGLIGRVRASDTAILSVAYSPDGRSIATGDAEGRLRLWSAAAVQTGPAVMADGRPLYSVAWSSTGAVLVAGSDKDLSYWSATLTPLTRVPIQDAGAKGVALFP